MTALWLLPILPCVVAADSGGSLARVAPLGARRHVARRARQPYACIAAGLPAPASTARPAPRPCAGPAGAIVNMSYLLWGAGVPLCLTIMASLSGSAVHLWPLSLCYCCSGAARAAHAAPPRNATSATDHLLPAAHHAQPAAQGADCVLLPARGCAWRGPPGPPRLPRLPREGPPAARYRSPTAGPMGMGALGLMNLGAAMARLYGGSLAAGQPMSADVATQVGQRQRSPAAAVAAGAGGRAGAVPATRQPSALAGPSAPDAGLCIGSGRRGGGWGQPCGAHHVGVWPVVAGGGSVQRGGGGPPDALLPRCGPARHSVPSMAQHAPRPWCAALQVTARGPLPPPLPLPPFLSVFWKAGGASCSLWESSPPPPTNSGSASPEWRPCGVQQPSSCARGCGGAACCCAGVACTLPGASWPAHAAGPTPLPCWLAHTPATPTHHTLAVRCASRCGPCALRTRLLAPGGERCLTRPGCTSA